MGGSAVTKIGNTGRGTDGVGGGGQRPGFNLGPVELYVSWGRPGIESRQLVKGRGSQSRL